VEAGGSLVSVELQPGGARIAVARLADAARVEQPFATLEVEQGAVACLGPARLVPAPGGAVEEKGDVGVADQADWPRARIHAGVGLLAGEHVLPDRVAGGSVEEGDLLALALRLELAQVGERLLLDVGQGPLDRGRGGLRERGDVERAEDG